MLAAIDVDFRPRHISRLLRAEIVDGLGHFLGLAEAAEGQFGGELLGPRRQDRGFDLPRGDGVDANAIGAEVA
jgi:hypothetical protein